LFYHSMFETAGLHVNFKNVDDLDVRDSEMLKSSCIMKFSCILGGKSI